MNTQKRNEYLQYFPITNCNALSEMQKSEHTRSNCDACQVDHFAIKGLFPNAAKLTSQKLVQDSLAQNENNGNTKEPNRKGC